MRGRKTILAAAAVLTLSAVTAEAHAQETEALNTPSAIKGVVLLGDTPDERCDVNGDGTVNVYDLMRYKRKRISPLQDTDSEKLVARLYRNVLQTEPDIEEALEIAERLENGSTTAADVITEFLVRPEYEARTLTDEEYISMMYTTILGREPDEEGYSNWCERINYISRQYAVRGFVLSKEFSDTCEENGILKGDIELTEARDKNYQLSYSVGQMYSRVLGHNASPDTLNAAVQDILDGRRTLQTYAFSLADYEEAVAPEISDSEYINRIFSALAGRNASDEEISMYTGQLSAGGRRQDVIRRAAVTEDFYELYSGRDLAGCMKRIGSNYKLDGVWYHLDPSGNTYAVENEVLLRLLGECENILEKNGTEISQIYKFCTGSSAYKYMERTKSEEEIEAKGWTFFADYAMSHSQMVCYYMAAQLDILFEQAGYRHRVVHGKHNDQHYWNQVYVNGTWLNYDVTKRFNGFTDQKMQSNGYITLNYVYPEYR